MPNIEAILAEQCALQKERPLIVGVSGGADSLCLMDILREAGYPLIVAHFDHQLREESHADAQMVKETCARLALECVVGSGNVRAYSEEKKLSIEEAARELRYRFMFNLARERNAQAVAVGHTADDQIETVLMHILRGSGLNGLRGMPYRSILQTFDADIPLVRPLLEMSRAETVAYCEAHSLHPHYDASNDSLEYKRNKIRHQLIPTLETYNPKIREALLRMSQTLKDDADLLDSLVDSVWQECATPQNGFVVLDFSLLTEHAAGLQRSIIRRAMRTLIPDVDVTYEILNRALTQRYKGAKAQRTDLKSGLYLLHEGSQIYVCKHDADPPLNLFPQMDSRLGFGTVEKNTQPTQPAAACSDLIPISIPSTIELAYGWTFTIEQVENFQAGEISVNENPLEVWFDADALDESLHLRKFRRGDRITPLGMDGHSQKISDLFVNEKIPQRARENWVLLCSGDEIVWVAGIRSAHFCRVTDSTKQVIHCVLTRS
jgi:tRNA(Ile)-lysidine synthase